EGKKHEVQVDDEGRLLSGQTDESPPEQMQGGYGYILDKDKKLRQFRESEGSLTEHVHHSSHAQGQAIRGGGQLRVDWKGKIKYIDNKSGHYRPGLPQMMQVVEYLLEQEALLETELVDENGKKVPPDSEVGQLYAKILVLQEGLMEKLAKDPKA